LKKLAIRNMTRFAKKKIEEVNGLTGVGDNYALGHNDKFDYAYKSAKGLTEERIREISAMKDEPEWMLDIRLKAYEVYLSKPMPKWGGDLSEIDFENIFYYLKPLQKAGRTWDDVPPEIKATFEKIGVPQAEREALAGVKSQYDSEVIYGSLRKNLSDKGVVFLGMDEGLKQYPELVKEYFGRVIPMGDNKLAALNTAVWSGGSFLYIPKGVDVELPLQTYFRINSENAGQFERTLIIADEGSKVHYIEGCFTKDVLIDTVEGRKKISQVYPDDMVMTHLGRVRKVGHIQRRKYEGSLYRIMYYGGSTEMIEATEEHPFLAVKRRVWNERNKNWTKKWLKSSELSKGDYLCIPIDKSEMDIDEYKWTVKRWGGKTTGFVDDEVSVPITSDFMRLVGYYLAEGSISSGSYLNFSFASDERDLIDDTKSLLRSVFGVEKIIESEHKKNHGTSVVVSSVRLCRIFEKFGSKNYLKSIPDWMMHLAREKQINLLKGWYLGDGNYYHKKHKSGFKETIRVNTTSEKLARQMRMIYMRLGVATVVNSIDRSKSGRRTMYTLMIAGEWINRVYEILGIEKDSYFETHIDHRRASMFGIDDKYMYVPIKEIERLDNQKTYVYNFGVDQDESYVAGGVAVHNCSAPSYSSGSLHAAVVEIFVKKGAKVQYTTVQNWYKNVYNLVTKRARVEEEGEMRWIDGNLGSRITMKYPACILAGRKARGEILSIAWAGADQHQDTGAKMIHLAPETTSQILSKSISKGGGRATYRGLVQINKGAVGARSKVVCDALILDEKSRSDTYPTNKIMENQSVLEHEAVVSRISEDQLFYLMSRGLSEHEAESMIVNGFLEPVMKEVPFEYAIEMNRLVNLEMEGSVG
jgi:Fe-S cluster assembly protein SufB